MTIHTDHPFAQPEGSRSPLRRLRGRLGGAVSLWTTGTGRDRAGLTVSSLLVADGDPGAVLGLVDPDSDLGEVVELGSRLVVQLLEWQQRDLAEMFAGTAPAPGGPFAQAVFVDTEWGPRLADAPAWAGARVVDTRAVGWSTEVLAEVEHVSIGEEGQPLQHRRGRWVRP